MQPKWTHKTYKLGFWSKLSSHMAKSIREMLERGKRKQAEDARGIWDV